MSAPDKCPGASSGEHLIGASGTCLLCVPQFTATPRSPVEQVADALRAALRKATIEPSLWHVDAWEDGNGIAGMIHSLVRGEKVGYTIRVPADATGKGWIGRVVALAEEAVRGVMQEARNRSGMTP